MWLAVRLTDGCAQWCANARESVYMSMSVFVRLNHKIAFSYRLAKYKDKARTNDFYLKSHLAS